MIYAIGKRLFWIYYKLFHQIRVTGLENIPMDSKAVLCANHVSLQDPLVLASQIKREISFLSKSELSQNIATKTLFNALHTIPVKREKMDMKAFRAAVKVLENDGLLGVFIQGTRVKETEDMGAKSGAVLFAQKSGAPIIPIHIKGDFKLFSKITVKIGKPRSMENYKHQKINAAALGEIADEVMDDIRKLGASSS